ncbi:MltA domain-containing protein [Thalassotalea euphylliae]
MHVKLFTLVFLTSISFVSSATFRFEKESTPNFGQLAHFKGSELCIVADNVATFMDKNAQDDYAVHAGTVFPAEITVERVKKTLNFLCETYRDDVRAKRNSRLHNREFLTQHFHFYRWYPDKTKADSIAKKSSNAVKQRMLNNIPNNQLFLTKYYTKLLDASEQQTKQYTQALYELPYDEQGLTYEQAEQLKASLTRYKYTRQQVIAGALLDKKLANPLVWITEEALHDVLLQGTGVLLVDDNVRYFNVHRNNHIAYDYHLGKREQARYWYFAEVDGVMGYGQEIGNKVALKAHVSLAGNVKQLGLGKLLLLNMQYGSENKARMAILADEGGAFTDNLFQLDLLVDSYRGWDDYHAANKNIGDYADVWLMVLKN